MYIAIANAIYSSGAEGGGGGKVPLTDATFQQAVNDALAEEPVTGLFDVVPYGMMPDWDVSQVTIMLDAFNSAEFFNGDISAWDVSSVTDMEDMFNSAYSFNQSLNSWDVSSVTNMEGMFSDAEAFDGDISAWDVSSVTYMDYMFSGAIVFNQPLDSWDVSSVTNMGGMFDSTEVFDGDISSWNVSSVTDMDSMFSGAEAFNQNINSWDVSSVEIMEGMFSNAIVFNQPLDSWDVSSVTDMSSMFSEAPLFNQSLNSWDVSSVTDMSSMFRVAEAFDGDISAWDVSSVTYMDYMFSGNNFGTNTIFNRDISAWNVSSVTDMRQMFYKNIAFNQNLSLWGITQVVNFIDFMTDVTLSTPNYDALLIGWDAQGAMSFSGIVRFGSSQYTPGGAAEAARTSLVAKWGGINDGGPATVPLILRVKTDNVGASNDDQFTLQVKNGTGYDYDIEYDGQTLTGLTTDNDVTLTFPSGAGSYDIRISGSFPLLFLQQSPDKSKLIEVKQWGNTNFGGTNSIQSAFAYNNLLTTVSATDVPVGPFTNLQGMFSFCSSLVSIPNLNNWDVSNITSIDSMFREASNFNGDMSSWNTSNITSMSYMLSNVPLFNGDISSWDVSSVTNFKWFLYNKSSWNNDLSSWDVSSATNMERMFQSCTIFNSDIGNWNVSNVTDMRIMFAFCSSFDQDLSSWQISQVTNFNDFMTGVTLSTTNYDALLIAWDAQGAMSYSGTVNFGNSQYTSGGAAEAARTSLIAKWGGIIDGGAVPVPFTISVKTDNVGTSNSDQFTIPWTGTYDVDWGDGNTDTSVVNAQTHTYATAGTYDVSVTATSGRIAFANGGDKLKLLDIKSWGDTAWTTMALAFRGCSNLTVLTATDTPDLSNLNGINYMFDGCLNFNSPINNWDVSNVTNMEAAFNDAFVFNQDLDLWDVSNVVSMTQMFQNAKVFNGNITTWNVGNVLSFSSFLNNWRVQSGTFNQDLSSWDVSSATNMSGMFSYQSSFNQDITSWNVSSVTNMSIMFALSGFNQPIGIWNVSNVTDMNQMFEWSAFDQSLSAWNTSNVTNMARIFRNVSKVRNNIEISGWTVSQVTNFLFFATGTTLSTTNYDALLIAWDAQGAMSFSGIVPFGSSKYTLGGAAEAARTSLIAKWGGITDGGGVVAPLIPLANIISEYKFENNTLDTVGTNNGTATNITYASGLVGQTGVFNGSTLVTLTEIKKVGSTPNWSISVLVNFNTFKLNNDIYSCWVGGDNLTFLIREQGGGQLEFYTYYNPSSIGGGFAIVTNIGAWYHIVCTYDGATMKAYVDGVDTLFDVSAVGTLPTPTEPEKIGGRINPSFDGKIDCLRVWDKALTQEEITDIATAELAGTDINP